MTSIRPRKWLAALLILVLGGLIRLPVEHRFGRELEAGGLAAPRLNLSLRDELGQSFFIAVLGGFRSLVASLIEVENLEAWSRQNWAKVDAAYALCNRLQPKEYHYWDFRAWMSAYNAFDYYKYQDRSRPGLDPWIRQNLVDHGIKVLKEGVPHLPEDYRLLRTLGALTSDFEKNQDADHKEASEWFYKAWQVRPDHRFLWRNYVYNLARAPGYELEAWPLLLEMYHSGPDPASDRTPTGMTLLVQLYPKVKAQLPGAELPPEVAALAPQILAKEAGRLDREAKRRKKEEDEFKALEDAALRRIPTRKAPPATAP